MLRVSHPKLILVTNGVSTRTEIQNKFSLSLGLINNNEWVCDDLMTLYLCILTYWTGSSQTMTLVS